MYVNDFERAQAYLVGGILYEQEIRPEWVEKVQPFHFHGSDWGRMYEVLLAVQEKHQAVPYPDAMHAFRVAGFEGVEFFEKLHRAEEESVGYAVSGWCVRKILEEHRKLALKETLTSCLTRLDAEDDPDRVAELAEQGIMAASVKPSSVYGPEELASIAFNLVDPDRQTQGERVMTGFPTIDREMNGLGPGEITLVSGVTGHGKTALLVNWLYHMGILSEIPSLFVSLEMGVPQVLERFVARHTGARIDQVRNRPRDMISACDAITKSVLHIADNTSRTVMETAALIQAEARKHKIRVFAVDYIGELVADRKKKEEERNDQMYQRWVRNFRRLAIEHQMTGIVLCQNNADGDLAESKSMAHVADLWVHFWRTDDGSHRIKVRKARYGPVGGTYMIDFDPARQTMRETGRI